MAKREFKPKRFGVDNDFFAKAMESAINHSGEYVIHKQVGKDDQNVAMKYDFVPQDANINGDYVLSGTNPKLTGFIDHFDDYPLIYKGGNSVHQPTGSQFEVKGTLYNAKRVDVNHRGFIVIELVASNNCDSPDSDFDDNFDDLMCEFECTDIVDANPKSKVFIQC